MLRKDFLAEMAASKEICDLAIKMGPPPGAKHDGRPAAKRLGTAIFCIEDALMQLSAAQHQRELSPERLAYIVGTLERAQEECEEALKPHAL